MRPKRPRNLFRSRGRARNLGEGRYAPKQVFDSSPAVLAVSPFAMERQLYMPAIHGATSGAIFPLKL